MADAELTSDDITDEPASKQSRAVFSSPCEKFCDTIILSFVCGNYCPIMN